MAQNLYGNINQNNTTCTCNKGLHLDWSSASSRHHHLPRMNFYPIEFKVFDNFTIHAAPDIFSPYNTIDIINTKSFYIPNAVPDLVQTFYLCLTLRQALYILYENIYKSLKDTRRNSILTLTMDTTLEYVVDDVGAVVCSSATNIYFILKLPSILKSNITW